MVYSAGGKRDVLLIVSEDDLSHPDVVPRRSAIELTQQLREKLENQGIARDQQTDDVTITRARYSQDKRYMIHRVETSQPGGERVTRESVLKHITTFMNNHYDTAGGGKNGAYWLSEQSHSQVMKIETCERYMVHATSRSKIITFAASAFF